MDAAAHARLRFVDRRGDAAVTQDARRRQARDARADDRDARSARERARAAVAGPVASVANAAPARRTKARRENARCGPGIRS